MKRSETLFFLSPQPVTAPQGIQVRGPWSPIALRDGSAQRFDLESNDRPMEARGSDHCPETFNYSFNFINPKTIAPKPQSRSGWRYHNAPT